MMSTMRVVRAMLVCSVIFAGLTGCAVATDGVPRATVIPTAPGSATSDAAPVPSTVPTQVPAPTPTPEDADLEGVIECDATPMDLGGIGKTFVLVGECSEVNVSGTDNTIDARDARGGAVSINGDRNAVTFGDATSVSVQGQSNVVSTGVVERVLIAGDRNAVTSAGSVGAISFSGNDNSVTATNAPTVTDSGDRNVVTQS